jgi:hypothetical protein
MSFSPTAGTGQGLPTLEQFINWYPVPLPNGKTDKIPCDTFGNNVDVRDRRKWRSFLQASTSAHRVGFIITPPYVFVDVDNAYNMTTGVWSDLARDVLATFPDAYTEVSQSGTGLHVIFRGTLPPGHRTQRKGLKLEVYTGGRFVALTGYMARGSAEVDYSDRITGFMLHYGLDLEPKPISFDEGRDSAWVGPENDDELIAMALAQRPTPRQGLGNAPTFRELWEMDIAALTRKMPAEGRADGLPFDHSTVDASLMANLSYFTGRDLPRMVRLFERWKGYRGERYTGKYAYRLERVVGVGASNPNVMQRGPGERALEASITPAPPGGKRQPCSNLLTLMNGADIAEMEFPPLQYLADEFLPMGCWLLIGPPKRGKTWLMLDLAVAVAGGGESLGFKCEQGRVLYLALEESKRRIQDRTLQLCRQKGLNPKETLGQILFGTTGDDDIPTADGGLYQMIADAMDADPTIKLVVVDTLHKARPMQRNGEGTYVYDRRCVDPFTDMLAARPGRAVVIVHHTRKSKSSDPFEMASGSMGLTGAADGHIFLLPDDQGQMVMHVQGRDCEPIEWAMKLNKAQWEVLGDPDGAGMSDTRAKILAAMQKYTMPVRAKDIAEDTGLEANTVSHRLRGLCKDGYVLKQGYGKFVLTPKSSGLGIAPTFHPPTPNSSNCP